MFNKPRETKYHDLLRWHSWCTLNDLFAFLPILKVKWAASWETLYMSYANNKGAGQPALPHSLISAFVDRCLNSIVSLVSKFAISWLSLASVAEQAGLSITWSNAYWSLIQELEEDNTDKWLNYFSNYSLVNINCGASSEFVSSSIPSWQILIAHAQPFRGARDLAFFLRVPLDSLLVWASSGGSGETARMRRLAWTFAARIGDKYQIRLTRPNLKLKNEHFHKLMQKSETMKTFNELDFSVKKGRLLLL